MNTTDENWTPIHAPGGLMAHGDAAAGDEPVLRVVNWLVQPGDQVSSKERVAELTFPGVLVYAVAEADGIMRQQLAKPGQTVRAEHILGWVQPAGERSTPETAVEPIKDIRSDSNDRPDDENEAGNVNSGE